MKLTKVEQEEYHNLKTLEEKHYANITRPGTKFHYCYDHDVWHIVGIMDDGDTGLVVMKSWSKSGRSWCYKIENIFVFVFTLGMLGELYKDEEGNYWIKDKKR